MSSFLDKEISSLIKAEISPAISIPPDLIPDIAPCPRPEAGDFAFHVGRLSGQRKVNPTVLSKTFVDQINDTPNHDLVFKAVQQGPYVNLFVDKAHFLRLAVERIEQLGEQFGSSTQPTPKRIIVEHTSANPNAPLHVGNLRNVMIGAHLARLQRFCGCDVKEYFFVNDLGSQIGLTVLGYSKLSSFPSGLKLDHMTGIVYAIMNTFGDAQKQKFLLSEFQEQVLHGPKEPEDAGSLEETPELKRQKVVWTGQSLYERYPDLYNALFGLFTDQDNINAQAGVLNKLYEDRDPATVAIFRKMACDTLTGHQATLDTYGVRHDRFDFESELSWEGYAGSLISLLSRTKYFHPQTQSNEQGVPQGAYIDLDAYLTDTKAKRGKGGFASPYPPFYVLRPDGTTLYTLRDVAYSMKKIGEADLVLNVICTEQNLPQEKVMLSLQAVGIRGRPQLHLAYELVKLTKAGEIVRMSGRRGIYVLADELYQDLRAKSLALRVKKQQVVDDEQREKIAHVLASAAMKYSLLCVSTRVEIAFDVEAAVDPKGNSAAFILYSGARIASIFRKFENGVAEGKFEPAPPEVDWSLLNDPAEWTILTKYVLPFATLIVGAALPTIPAPPKLAEFGTHVIPQFSYQLANEFASYYGRVKILCGGPAMYARLRFCRAVQQVLKNALRLFMVEPLDAM